MQISKLCKDDKNAACLQSKGSSNKVTKTMQLLSKPPEHANASYNTVQGITPITVQRIRASLHQQTGVPAQLSSSMPLLLRRRTASSVKKTKAGLATEKQVQEKANKNQSSGQEHQFHPPKLLSSPLEQHNSKTNCNAMVSKQCHTQGSASLKFENKKRKRKQMLTSGNLQKETC